MNIIEQALGRGNEIAARLAKQAAAEHEARWAPLVKAGRVTGGDGYFRCPDHRNGGATRCPRGGAALQIWQRKQWGE